MANNASKRKFPAVVVGLKNLDNAKEMINKYLSGEATTENEAYYLKLKSFVEQGLVNSETKLNKTDSYQVDMNSVMKNNDIISISISVGATITFLLFFIILNVLMPLILKNGQTLGKKVLHLALCDENAESIKFSHYILREVLELVMFSCVCVFIPYLLLQHLL